MRRRTTPLPHLLRDRQGSAITEFGLIAPVFFLLMLSTYDLAHMAYARSIFEGAVERAARDASLEGADTAAADLMVENAIKPVLPGVALETERKSYFDFTDIGRPEEFGDMNGNNICDEGESYVDENDSGGWDADIGVAGNGGAGDVIIYTVTATYSPVFHVPFMPAAWADRTLTATAVKKNQPFATQRSYVTTAGTCTE